MRVGRQGGAGFDLCQQINLFLEVILERHERRKNSGGVALTGDRSIGSKGRGSSTIAAKLETPCRAEKRLLVATQNTAVCTFNLPASIG